MMNLKNTFKKSKDEWEINKQTYEKAIHDLRNEIIDLQDKKREHVRKLAKEIDDLRDIIKVLQKKNYFKFKYCS